MYKVMQTTTVDLSMRFLLLNTLKHLAERGYDVVGVCSNGPHIPHVQEQGIRVVTVDMTRRITPLKDLKSLYELYRTFKRERPVIVHSHTPKANLIGQWAAKLAGVPIQVSTVHGLYYAKQMGMGRSLFFLMMERLSAVFANVVFFVNEEDVETAKRMHLCSLGKIRLFPGGLGIDLARFDRAKISDTTLAAKRCEFGLDPDVPVVGFVGRLVAEKGLIELFAAFHDLTAKHPTARLLLIGPADVEKPDCIGPEVAALYGIADRCIFAGLRNDLPELYCLMDVLTLPSHREGFALVLTEAAAMGVPVVATDIRGCRTTVAAGRNGLLVPLENPAALAEALDFVLCDKARAREMGRQGQILARERFDQQVAFAVVAREYERLVAAKRNVLFDYGCLSLGADQS